MSPRKTAKPKKKLTRKDILRMIEKNGGPEALDLSQKDLSEIDLGSLAIGLELAEWQESHPGGTPVWFSPAGAGITPPQAYLSHLRVLPTTGGINLQKADLSLANIRGANLAGANLRGASLQMAHIQHANLSAADLQEAILEGANLQKTDLGGANLQEADLGGADLQEAALGLANLRKANLWAVNLQKAYLGLTNLQEAVLWRANLREAILEEANLGGVDLSSVVSLVGVRWRAATLDHIKLPPWEKLSPIGEDNDRKYEVAQQIYLLFKDNFNDAGHYEWAREAYVKEREMERNAHKKNKHWWPWFWLTLFRCTSTYGQNPIGVLFWIPVLIILFGVFYILSGGITPVSSETTTWWPTLYSLYAFATMQYPDYQATNIAAHFLTSIEGLIGIFWLAYFVYALANRTRSF